MDDRDGWEKGFDPELNGFEIPALLFTKYDPLAPFPAPVPVPKVAVPKFPELENGLLLPCTAAPVPILEAPPLVKAFKLLLVLMPAVLKGFPPVAVKPLLNGLTLFPVFNPDPDAKGLLVCAELTGLNPWPLMAVLNPGLLTPEFCPCIVEP